MAAPSKKARVDEPSENDPMLDNFIEWLKTEGFTLSTKVYISKRGSCAGYGMLAREDIEKGESLFKIPRASILRPESCSIKDRIAKNINALSSNSGWVPLLISLMYEYNNKESKWRPYLDLCPNYEELDHPMFWARSLLEKELKGTSIIPAVHTDLKRMKNEYSQVVVPFLKKNKDIFTMESYSFDLYKKMVAFVMAYSFTEPPLKPRDANDDNDISDDDDDFDSCNPPVMVPLADILNHVSENNAKLQFESDYFEMLSIAPIKAGEEIFNTFGELSNAELLQMYGFALQDNCYDIVNIPFRFIEECHKNLKVSKDKVCEKPTDLIDKLDALTGDDEVMVVGTEGVLNQEQASDIMKILSMDDNDVVQYQNAGTWEDNEDVEFHLDNDSIANTLEQDWKAIIASAASHCLEGYSIPFEVDKCTVEKPKEERNLSRRETWALYVRHGQRKILKNLIELCNTKRKLN